MSDDKNERIALDLLTLIVKNEPATLNKDEILDAYKECFATIKNPRK